jgi:biotin transport system substrate-specific component
VLTTTHAATLRTAFFPRSTLLTNVLLILGGAILVALCAQVSISFPFTPVPVTGQTFAVVLVGASLGPLSGALSLALYVLAGIAGAPVYADGTHGWDVIVSATGGYLIGFVLAAALTGLLAARAWDRRFRTATSAMLAGNVVIYLVGLPWLAWKLGTDSETTLELGLYPFVIGDLLKLYLAAALLPAAWKIVDSRRS